MVCGFGIVGCCWVVASTGEGFPWRLLFANLPAVLEVARTNPIQSVSLVLQSTDYITMQIELTGAPPQWKQLHLIPRHRDDILEGVKAIIE